MVSNLLFTIVAENENGTEKKARGKSIYILVDDMSFELQTKFFLKIKLRILTFV